MLNRRLGIYLEERAWILEDREHFDVKGLDKYFLEQTLVEKGFSGRSLKDFLPLTKASGQLPHGTVGECVYDNLCQRVNRFVKKTEPYLQETPLGPVEIDLTISDFKLTGRIDSIYPQRLMQYRYARVKPKDRLKVWIHHLVLNSLRADHYPLTSMLVGLQPTGPEPEWMVWEFSPLKNSEEVLAKLLQTYWEGLARPVHFFPGSSWEYVQMLVQRNKPKEVALRRACNTWVGSKYQPGESEDAYYQLCFRNTDPLDSEFQNLATKTFGPLLASQKHVET